jgi:hypothetical protein
MASFLKLETGDYLLLETGDKLLLEAQDAGPAFQANAFQGDAFQIGPPAQGVAAAPFVPEDARQPQARFQGLVQSPLITSRLALTEPAPVLPPGKVWSGPTLWPQRLAQTDVSVNRLPLTAVVQAPFFNEELRVVWAGFVTQSVAQANRQPLTDLRPVGAQDLQQRIYDQRLRQADTPENRQPLTDIPPVVFGTGRASQAFPAFVRQTDVASNALLLLNAAGNTPVLPGDTAAIVWRGSWARTQEQSNRLPLTQAPEATPFTPSGASMPPIWMLVSRFAGVPSPGGVPTTLLPEDVVPGVVAEWYQRVRRRRG